MYTVICGQFGVYKHLDSPLAYYKTSTTTPQPRVILLAGENYSWMTDISVSLNETQSKRPTQKQQAKFYILWFQHVVKKHLQTNTYASLAHAEA